MQAITATKRMIVVPASVVSTRKLIYCPEIYGVIILTVHNNNTIRTYFPTRDLFRTISDLNISNISFPQKKRIYAMLKIKISRKA